MAQQSKNDSSLRSMLMKQGAINAMQGHTSQTRKDPKASQAAAIAARRAEMRKTTH